MPWVVWNKKACAEYIKLCEVYNKEKDKNERLLIEKYLEGFLDAIGTIQGMSARIQIGMQADLALPNDDRPAFLGRYLDLN